MVALFGDFDRIQPEAFPQFQPVVDGLRAYGASVPGSLPPPILTARLKRRLEATAAAFARLRNVRAVARHLRIPAARVRDQLAILQALRGFGPLRSVPCGRGR